MALVASGSRLPNAEIELAEALRDFEAILSEEQRQTFRSSGHPNAKAAIELATQVDQECNAKRRQCMGPRVLIFTDSLQQVYGTVDTFISSHPEVAALVWGGVKVTILAANNVASYFDKISTLFMDVGRQCHRMQALGSSYPSKGLQRTRCEYSTAVLRLCKHVLTFLAKPAYTQWSKALFISFKAEFGCYEQEFAQRSQAIRDEAFLAQSEFHKKEAELQAKERAGNEASRVTIRKLKSAFDWSDERRESELLLIQRWRAEDKKAGFLKALSTHEYQAPLRRFRRDCVPGTCEWIFKRQDFNNWLNGPSSTFWLVGRLGSGKSMNSSSVVTHLVSSCLPTDIVSYFFCRFDHEESLNAQIVIGSIIQQMVRHLPAEKFQGCEIDGNPELLSTAFAEKLLDENRRHFVILDGIDDMEKDQIEQVLEFLKCICTRSDLLIKTFLSSRPHTLSRLRTKLTARYKLDLNHSEVENQVSQDIETFIDVTLEDWLGEENPEFVGDPRHIVKIHDTLSEKANGMFLWVKLQLQTLATKHSDEEILNALDDLPKDLPETFNRMLAPYADSKLNATRKRILNWVLVAKRPLKLEEIREAISIKPLQSAWEPQRLVNDVRKAIADCNNLVVIDEELHTVHFTHGTIKQYLLHEDLNGTLNRNYIDHGVADATAGAICVTYLSFPSFERRVTRAQKSIETSDLTSAVVANAFELKGASNHIALRLLKSRKQVGRPLDQVFKNVDVNKEDVESPFLPYALEFWIHHTSRAIKERSKELWRLWCNLVEIADSRHTLSGVPWTLKGLNDGLPIVTYWIVKYNHHSWAQFVIDHPRERIAPIHTDYLFYVSTLRPNIELLDFCLTKNKIAKHTLFVGLISAVLAGNLDVARKLLMIQDIQQVTFRHEVWKEIFGWDWALFQTTDDDHSTSISDDQYINRATKLFNLLQQGTSYQSIKMINVPQGFALLAAALLFGPPELFQTLLRLGWDVDHKDRWGATALTRAAEVGLDSAVEQLLSVGASINHRDNDGSTALMFAASRGHISTVKHLLSVGASINQRDNDGSTALELAASCGHLSTVQELLKAGARHVDIMAIQEQAIEERMRLEAYNDLQGEGRWTTTEDTLRRAGVTYQNTEEQILSLEDLCEISNSQRR